MRNFFDSSALAKRYVAEISTHNVLQLCQDSHQILLSVIVVPELLSAFNRLRREQNYGNPTIKFSRPNWPPMWTRPRFLN